MTMTKPFAVEFISEKKGRGLVAKESIKEGAIVEVAHVLVLSEDDYIKIQDTLLYEYIFEWDLEEPRTYAIALNDIEFINHSSYPNVEYEFDYPGKMIIFKAIKNIDPGEEILFNYRCHGRDNTTLWFDAEETDTSVCIKEEIE